VIYAVTNLMKQFHPNSYAAVNASTTKTTNETTTTSVGSEETTTGSQGQPGFGVTSAIVVMFGTLLLVGRWRWID
jgi:PGF-CTERM protein